MNFLFKCEECGSVFNVDAKNYDEAKEIKKCECGSTKARRYFSADSLPGTSAGGQDLKTPYWFKEKVGIINKEHGTNVKLQK